MATFAQNLVASLTQPSYTQGLLTAAERIGSAPRRMQEEKDRLNRLQEQNEAFELYRQGLFSSDQGDVSALYNRSSDLSQMLKETEDENIRADLMQKISSLDQLAGETKSRATSNKANAIIQVEQTLAGYKNRGDADLTEQERRVKQVLTERLKVLKQDTQALSQAEEAKRTARLTKLQNDEAMAVAETNAMKRELGNIDPESPEWDRAASKYPRLGSAVKQLRNVLLEIKIESQENLDKLAEGTPLTPDEVKRIEDLGLGKFLTENDRANRALLVRITNAEIKKREQIALQELDPMTTSQAKSFVIDHLSMIVEKADIESLPIIQDLSDKVEELLEDPEELELFMGRVDGKTSAQAENVINAYLQEKFPEKYAEMQTELRRRAGIIANERQALQDIFVATNLARGEAAGLDRPLDPEDENYFDPNNPDDVERAKIALQRKRSQERAATPDLSEIEIRSF